METLVALNEEDQNAITSFHKKAHFLGRSGWNGNKAIQYYKIENRFCAMDVDNTTKTWFLLDTGRYVDPDEIRKGLNRDIDV